MVVSRPSGKYVFFHARRSSHLLARGKQECTDVKGTSIVEMGRNERKETRASGLDEKKLPMEAARPTQTVEMSGRTCRMVSNTAIPAVTDPPGEFTYRVIS